MYRPHRLDSGNGGISEDSLVMHEPTRVSCDARFLRGAAASDYSSV